MADGITIKDDNICAWCGASLFFYHRRGLHLCPLTEEKFDNRRFFEFVYAETPHG